MNFPIVRKAIQPWETKWSLLLFLLHKICYFGGKKEKKTRNINTIPIKENDISGKMDYHDLISCSIDFANLIHCGVKIFFPKHIDDRFCKIIIHQTQHSFLSSTTQCTVYSVHNCWACTNTNTHPVFQFVILPFIKYDRFYFNACLVILRGRKMK